MTLLKVKEQGSIAVIPTAPMNPLVQLPTSTSISASFIHNTEAATPFRVTLLILSTPP